VEARTARQVLFREQEARTARQVLFREQEALTARQVLFREQESERWKTKLELLTSAVTCQFELFTFHFGFQGAQCHSAARASRPVRLGFPIVQER
jgi:hypothetical protein